MKSAAVAQGELYAPSELAVDIRPNPRARRLSVRVYPGGRVAVTVPRGVRPAAVEAFLANHRDWIATKVAQYRLEEGHELPAQIELPSTGDHWSVHYRPGRAAFRVCGDRVLEIQHPPERAVDAQRALTAWAIAEARRSLEPWLAAVASETGLQYRAVQWRRQRTRWGSCSSRGTLSLNVAALFQPPEVVRYLFVHELSHTRHMNHSRRFWALVESFEPDYLALDRALSEGWRLVPAWLTTGGAV